MYLLTHLQNFSDQLYDRYTEINPIEVITNYHYLRDGKVFFIENGKENLIFPSTYKSTITKIRDYSKKTFKVEGFENFDNYISEVCSSKTDNEYIDCHLYWGKEGKSSFVSHIDPYDVFILVLSGIKKLIIEKEEIILKEGNSIYIPGHKNHYADNITDGVSLSFGIRKYYNTADLKLQYL